MEEAKKSGEMGHSEWLTTVRIITEFENDLSKSSCKRPQFLLLTAENMVGVCLFVFFSIRLRGKFRDKFLLARVFFKHIIHKSRPGSQVILKV